MKLKDVLKPRTVYKVQLDGRLGEGAQGEVYRVARFNGHATPYVLKLYRTPAHSPEGRHLAAFVAYLDRCPDVQARALAGIPQHVVVDERRDRVGCLTRFVPGHPLERHIYERLYDDPRGLAARLRLGARLAEIIGALHAHHIVHADITEPNILVDPTTLTPGVIDVDGGGVLASPLGPEYLRDLHPLIRGRFEGSFLAPEMVLDSRRLPSLASDRWSLAVLLHRILFGGLDPFFFLEAFADVFEPDTRWPPNGSSGSRLQSWIHFHQAELQRLGPVLRHRFCTSFNKGHDGAWSPALRPQAKDWARDLEIAARWVRTCPGCREQFVALRIRTCPFCQADVPHALVWTYRKRIVLDQEGTTLLGRHVGFSDQEGRYEVASFGRRGDKVLITPRLPMRDLRSGWDYTPQQAHPIAVGRGRHALRVWSRDGRQQAEIRISMP